MVSGRTGAAPATLLLDAWFRRDSLRAEFLAQMREYPILAVPGGRRPGVPSRRTKLDDRWQDRRIPRRVELYRVVQSARQSGSRGAGESFVGRLADRRADRWPPLGRGAGIGSRCGAGEGSAGRGKSLHRVLRLLILFDLLVENERKHRAAEQLIAAHLSLVFLYYFAACQPLYKFMCADFSHCGADFSASQSFSCLEGNANIRICRRTLVLAGAFLAISAAYLYTFPQPNIFYAAWCCCTRLEACWLRSY